MYCQLDHSVSDGKMCIRGKYLVSGAYKPLVKLTYGAYISVSQRTYMLGQCKILSCVRGMMYASSDFPLLATANRHNHKPSSNRGKKK